MSVFFPVKFYLFLIYRYKVAIPFKKGEGKDAGKEKKKSWPKLLY